MLRINPHNFGESYITVEQLSKDVLVEGFTQRNRALEGDIVVIQLNDKLLWKALKTIDQDKEDEEETV